MDKEVMQIILIVVNAFVAIAGFVISFMILRLYKSIDMLARKDEEIAELVASHREDVLRNYSSNARFNELKTELVTSFNRFEDKILAAIRNIP